MYQLNVHNIHCICKYITRSDKQWQHSIGMGSKMGDEKEGKKLF